MAEAAAVQGAAPVAEAAAVVGGAAPTPAETKGMDVIAEGEVNSPKEYTPLFEKEVPSEDDLMGSDEAEPGEEGKPAGGEEKKQEVKQEVKPDDKKETPAKPPEGYVPVGALHEERAVRKQLLTTVEQLQREIDLLKKLPAEQEQEPEDAFKPLSETEEDELMEKDIFAYQKYQRDLRKHERAQEQKRNVEAETAYERHLEEATVKTAYAMMEQAVPGLKLADPNNEVNRGITMFATSNGLPSSVLSALTDPKTKVIVAGQNKPVLMGKAAAGVAYFLNQIYQKAAKSQQSAGPTRADIEKELRPLIEAEVAERVTKEFTSKLKNKPTAYQSIGDVPGSGDKPEIKGPITEAAMKKLSHSEQEKLLGG